MKNALLVVFLMLLLITGAHAQNVDDCKKETLEIREKAADGSTLRLEFGSLWAIEPAEWANTRTWLRLEKVHICEDGLKKRRYSICRACDPH